MKTVGVTAVAASIRSALLGAGVASTVLLVLALITDLGFIELHRLSLRGLLGPEYSIEADRGYAECYQYLKESAIALMSLALFLRRGDALYLCWALLFAYLLCDDSLMLHERAGALIADRFHLAPALGVGGQDLGELLALTAVGAGFFALFAVGYARSAQAGRRASLALLALLLALAMFGVVVDMVHMMVLSDPWHYRLGMIEDGGEMLVMSTVLWFVFSLLRSADEPSDEPSGA